MRRYLTAGLLVWVPLGVTILIIKFMVDLMDQSLLFIPPPYRPDALFGFHIPGLGVLLTAVVVVGTGMIVANLFGRQLVNIGERLLAHIPIVRSIYSGVKQLMETVFSSKGESFRKVVLVEYPRIGIWTVAFITSEAQGEAQRKTGHDTVNLYVPTTPNPTSGFFLIVPRKDVIELDMSVDDGLKMILSVGVVVPPERKTPAPAPVRLGSRL